MLLPSERKAARATASNALPYQQLPVGTDVAQVQASLHGQGLAHFARQRCMHLSRFQGRRGPDFVSGSTPGQLLRTLVLRASGNVLTRGAQNYDIAAIVGGVGVSVAGKV